MLGLTTVSHMILMRSFGQAHSPLAYFPKSEASCIKEGGFLCPLLPQMSIAVACTFPTYAEKIFAITGCTAVCLVCYVSWDE